MNNIFVNPRGEYLSEYCRKHLFEKEYFPISKLKPLESMLRIEKVIFNDPATIVYWSDGTKTVVKCSKGDREHYGFDPEKGLAMAIAKKGFGNDGSFHKEFKKWIKPEQLEKMELLNKLCSAFEVLNKIF